MYYLRPKGQTKFPAFTTNISPITHDADAITDCRNKIVEDRPDAHLTLSDGKGRLVARCSVWWSNEVLMDGAGVGFIGHFAAAGAAWAHELLNKACTVLAAEGVQVAIGPVDGSTWKRYRFVTFRGNEPAFFLEPDNPDSYPLYFLESGFSIMSDYYSTACDSLADAPSKVVPADGISIRSLGSEPIEAELNKLYDVSIEAFANNFLYQPIERREFLAMYSPLIRFINPDLLLIAEDNGKTCGFILAIPDPGAAVPTVIVKTAARLPGRRYAGIGRYLLELVHSRAAGMGYSRAIQALMHESNSSLSISRCYGKVIRRYSLFSRTLV